MISDIEATLGERIDMDSRVVHTIENENSILYDLLRSPITFASELYSQTPRREYLSTVSKSIFVFIKSCSLGCSVSPYQVCESIKVLREENKDRAAYVKQTSMMVAWDKKDLRVFEVRPKTHSVKHAIICLFLILLFQK